MFLNKADRGIFSSVLVNGSFHRLLAVITLIFMFAACSSPTESKKETAPATLSSIAISPGTPLLAKGRTQQLSVIATMTDSSTENITSRVTWGSSDQTKATVSSGGLLTGVAVGSATMTASDATSGKSATATATVTAAEATGLSIDQSSPALAVGSTLQITATATFSDATTLDVTDSVTWALTSSNGFATIATTGLISGGTGAGTDTVRATLGSLTSTATVEVATLSGITVSDPSAASTVIATGTTRQLAATGALNTTVNTATTTQDLTAQAAWSTSSPGLADVGTVVSSPPPATAPPVGAAAMLGSSPRVGAMPVDADTTPGLLQGSGATTANVSADFGGKTNTLAVIIANVTSLAASPSSLDILAGATETLVATATLDAPGTPTQDVTAFVSWGSFNTSLASVDDAGVVTGISEGATAIVATFEGQIVQVPVNVAPILTGITLSASNTTLFPGSTVQLTASGVYSGTTETPRDITSLVAWSSGDSSVGIDEAGLATGTSAGRASITATLDGQRASITLTVAAATLSSIAVTPAAQTTVIPYTVQFVATGTFSDTSTRKLSGVTWSSDNASVTINSATGLATAVSAGTATITATKTSISGTTTLTVDGAATPTTVSVTPASATLASGETRTFSASASFAAAVGSLDLAEKAAWASSNPTAWVIDPVTGIATAQFVASPANVTVTAMYRGISGTATVTVNPPSVLAISVSPGSVSRPAGLTQQFTAAGLFSDGTSAELTSGITWSSNNASVTIGASTGLATAVSVGSATITASNGSVSSSATFTVTAPVLSTLALAPSSASIALGGTQQFTLSGTLSNSGAAQPADLAGTVWSSDNGNVATVNSSGLVTGVAAGTATISARVGTVTTAATLTVGSAAPVLSALALAPSAASIGVGGSQQFTLSGMMSDSSAAQPADLADAVWSSDNESVATVNSTGLAQGVAAGTVAISATIGAVTTSADLTVIGPLAVSIISPVSNQSIIEGEFVSFEAEVTGGYLPVTIAWDFDANGTGTGPAPSAAPAPGNVTFNTPGTYLVRVTATDNQSNVQTAEVTIEVAGASGTRLAHALPLYDDFTGSHIDGSLWDGADGSRTIVRGYNDTNVLRMRAAAENIAVTPGTKDGNDMLVNARQEALSLQTTVTLRDVVHSGARAETLVRLYVQPKGSVGIDSLNYFGFDVRLREDDSGLKIGAFTFGCATADCEEYDTLPVLSDTFATSAANLDQAYTVRIEINTSTQQATVTNVDTGGARVVNLAGVIGSGAFDLANAVVIPQLRVRINTSDGSPAGGSGSMEVEFDDVLLDDVLYDDFEAGAIVDAAKWTGGSVNNLPEISLSSRKGAARALL